MSGNKLLYAPDDVLNAHPQNKKYQARINKLLAYADELANNKRPILHSNLLKFTMTEIRVSERTAKEYVKAVLMILEDRK